LPKLFQLEQKVSQADVVVTGEGRLDGQTLEGKRRLAWPELRGSIASGFAAIVVSSIGGVDYSQLFDAIMSSPGRRLAEPMRLS